MNRRTFVMVLASAFIAWLACEKEASAPEFQDEIVVEAYLVAGDTLRIEVDRQIPFDAHADFSTDDIRDLDIQVLHKGINHVLTFREQDEKYVSEELIVQDGDTYDLSFEYAGELVRASTVIPDKPVDFTSSASSIVIEQIDFSSGFPSGFEQPDPITLTWRNDDASNYLVVVENTETDPEATVDFGDGDAPERLFRNEPTLENSFEINSRSLSYYGRHRIILFHLNPDYASLFDDGGTTSQNLTTPSTGIENGLGIFTGMNTDTLWLDVLKD